MPPEVVLGGGREAGHRSALHPSSEEASTRPGRAADGAHPGRRIRAGGRRPSVSAPPGSPGGASSGTVVLRQPGAAVRGPLLPFGRGRAKTRRPAGPADGAPPGGTLAVAVATVVRRLCGSLGCA